METKELLQKHIHRIINRQHESFKDILTIVDKQPQWQKKIDTIYAFKITRLPKGNKPIVLFVKLFNNDKWFMISWRNANKNRKKPDELQSAFRDSIRDQIVLWKKLKGFGAKCVMCDSVDMLEVDHKEPSFIQLTKSFLDFEITENIPSVFGYNKRCGRTFLDKDKDFMNRWKAYHMNNATLQWLCKKCNLLKR